MALADDLQTMVTNWSAALVADSTSPQPSYSLDGKDVKRDEWRDGLFKKILEANKMINALNPYVVVTKVTL
jgi:23S rRNA A2030 N6-methylase RlmJ